MYLNTYLNTIVFKYCPSLTTGVISGFIVISNGCPSSPNP